MNKKGADLETGKELVMMFATVFFVGLGLVLMRAGAITINETGGSSELLAKDLLVEQLVNNPACFAYQNPVTGRVQLGIIDFEKFNDEQLQRCSLVGTPQRQSSMYASLIMITPGQSLQSVMNAQTNTWRESARIQAQTQRNILIYFEGKIYEGILDIQVQ